MELGICSYSFHRTFDAGAMDVFSYITLCHELGCTQLDPLSQHIMPALEDAGYRKRLQAAASDVGLPFGVLPWILSTSMNLTLRRGAPVTNVPTAGWTCSPS